jgi:quercetin dioxygenase-like cupin family protein
MALISAVAQAQTTAPIARTVDDSKIQWGACPAFLPQGCQIGVLHGDPAKPNTDLFFKVPGKSKIASHWHTSAERMVLVQGELRVTYEGSAPVTLRPGSYAYGPPKLRHDGECVSSEPCVLFIAFEQAVDAHPSEPAAASAAGKTAGKSEVTKKRGGC